MEQVAGYVNVGWKGCQDAANHTRIFDKEYIWHALYSLQTEDLWQVQP